MAQGAKPGSTASVTNVPLNPNSKTVPSLATKQPGK